MTEIYAIIATILLVGLSFFQIALALGAPLGKYAWGGAHATLPSKLRIASVSSIILYCVFISFMVSKAGILPIVTNEQILGVGMWVFTIYFLLGIPLNAISRSKKERYAMTPVVAILAVLFLLVTIK